MMRFTVIDGHNGLCFVASHEVLPLLVAACSHDPKTLLQFLSAVGRYDPQLQEYVASGAAVFDEHNTKDHLEEIQGALAAAGTRQPTPVFRILDDVTRRASLEPFKWGLVLFNVPRKRIIQIQNTYMAIRREGRVITPGVSGERRSLYRLPQTWRIVP